MKNLATEGPPPYQVVTRHAVYPEFGHDDAARFNFLANVNRFLGAEVLPGNQLAYEQRVKPRFEHEQGRPPRDRHEVRRAMADDPVYQTWSALRRTTMEMRQQNGRLLVLGQLDRLNEKAAELNRNADTLQLDPSVPVPRYIAGVDHHCMPGSYHTALADDDVSAAANYDCGFFATTTGLYGRLNDGPGQGVAAWLRENPPAQSPRRILDIGCGIGHNTLPIAQLYPEAEVVAIDVAAPMLRYGHARAKALGVDNVRFEQRNVEDLADAEESYDLVLTMMMLHETSGTAIKKLMRQTHRLLGNNGLALHLEQPQYEGMDPYEQFMRDWDAHNNNEPFWTTMHDLNLTQLATDAGFDADDCFEDVVEAVIDEDLLPPGPPGEDFGRAPRWLLFGTRKR